MGANTDFREYYHKPNPDTRKRKLNKDIVEKLFGQDQQDSAYESGHSYSGCIGVMPSGIKWVGNYKTEEEARTYIEDNHEKWNEAMGASFDKSRLYGKRISKKWSGYIVGGWCSS